MLYHERELKNKENAHIAHIVYLLAKLCNIFDGAFFIDVSIASKQLQKLMTSCSLCVTTNLFVCISPSSWCL